MPKILSTLTADNEYLTYSGETGNGVNTVAKRVKIKGGANVASQPHALASGVLTPKHSVTHVSDEDLKHLESVEEFRNHIKRGFLIVMNDGESEKSEVKAVKADLEAKDGSAPYAPEDFKEGGRAQIKSEKGEDGEPEPALKVKTGGGKK